MERSLRPRLEDPASTRAHAGPAPRRPFASATSNARSSAWRSSPASPARTNARCSRSSTGSPRRNTCPTSKRATEGAPRCRFRLAASSSFGRRLVRRYGSSADGGFATRTGSPPPISSTSAAEANVSDAPSRRPRGPAAPAAGGGSGRCPARRPRDGTEAPSREPVVALDPDDLLDQVLLPLEVGPEARRLDVDDVAVGGRGDPDRRERVDRLRRRPGSRGPPRRGSGAERQPAPRRRRAGVDRARRTRPPVHSAIRRAARAAAGPTPSGSVPRENRTEASVSSWSRREVRRIDRGSKYALSSRTSRRRPGPPRRTRRPSPPRSRPGPPGRRSAGRRRARARRRRASPPARPAPERRTTIPGPANRRRSNACSGWPSSSIA